MYDMGDMILYRMLDVTTIRMYHQYVCPVLSNADVLKRYGWNQGSSMR